MAAVNRKTKERIDWLLRWLIEFWSEIPTLEEYDSQLDGSEQIDYAFDEVPRSCRLLLELDGFMNSGSLSEQQLEEYRRLQDLIAQNTPKLEQLLAS